MMTSSIKRPQLKSVLGEIGGSAPYFDNTMDHLHVWKLSNVIDKEKVKFEQNAKSKTIENKIPMKAGVEYCSVCHIKRPPIFRIKMNQETSDWCELYNRETVRMENKMSYETCAKVQSEAEKLTKKQLDELITSYREDVPHMWKSGKYEEVQYYLKKMVSLGCWAAVQEMTRVENQLEKNGMKDRIVEWFREKDQMHELSRELKNKCKMSNEASPAYNPNADRPKWEVVGNLFNSDDVRGITYNVGPYVYKDALYHEQMIEARAFVREDVNRDVGKRMKVTDDVKKVLRRKQVMPKYMNKPSLFIPKTGIIKGSEEWEGGMILVLKKEKVERKPSTRVVHGGGKYRVVRDCRVKLLENEKRLLKVA